MAVSLDDLPPVVTVKMICDTLDISRPTLTGMVERGEFDPPLQTGTNRMLWAKRSLSDFLGTPVSPGGAQIQEMVRIEVERQLSPILAALIAALKPSTTTANEAHRKPPEAVRERKRNEGVKLLVEDRAARAALFGVDGMQEIADYGIGTTRRGKVRYFVYRMPLARAEEVEGMLRQQAQFAKGMDEEQDAEACLRAADTVHQQIELQRGESA